LPAGKLDLPNQVRHRLHELKAKTDFGINESKKMASFLRHFIFDEPLEKLRGTPRRT
jgi:hypothetical protein